MAQTIWGKTNAKGKRIEVVAEAGKFAFEVVINDLSLGRGNVVNLGPKDAKACGASIIIKTATSYVALTDDEAAVLRAAITANSKAALAAPASPIAQYDMLVIRAVEFRDQQQDEFRRMMSSGSSHLDGVNSLQVEAAQQTARDFRAAHPEIEPILAERKAVRAREIAEMIAASQRA